MCVRCPCACECVCVVCVCVRVRVLIQCSCISSAKAKASTGSTESVILRVLFSGEVHTSSAARASRQTAQQRALFGVEMKPESGSIRRRRVALIG